jgi:HD-GYP domain-containing protein (c-di-GMP phosphodiesterase class II)
MKVWDWSRAFFFRTLSEGVVEEYFERLKEHHADTGTHSMRVGIFSVDLGRRNGIEGEDLVLLAYGGVLHDIGKVRVPLEILEKEGELTGKEREIMNGHPRLGYLELKGFNEEVRQIVVAHHEFKNNDPYPRKGGDRRSGMRGDERREPVDRAHRLGEIVAVCDLYDALVNPRAYKESFSLERVRDILGLEFRGDPKYVGQVLEWYEA